MASHSKPRNFLRPQGPSRSLISGDQNVFLLQFLYKKTLANCNKASIKKSSAHKRNCSLLNRFLYSNLADGWSSCNFRGAFTGPLEPSQNMFRGGRQVFQVGQAPSGPTVIRSLFFSYLKSTNNNPLHSIHQFSEYILCRRKIIKQINANQLKV